MVRFNRRTMGAGIASLAAAAVTPARSSAEPATQLYVGHAARLTARIPSAWSVGPDDAYDYVGGDGFVASEPVAGATLDEACANLATAWRFDGLGPGVPTTWAGGAACRMSGTVNGADAEAIVVAHPRPFDRFGQLFAFAAVIADPAHLDAIAATIDFSPDRVTPEAYITSVLDIVEARAYWSDQVDWHLARLAALASIEGLETVEEAQGALLGILDSLYAVGDNHSLVVLPSSPDPLQEASGFGLLVGGRTIVAVFPDGPAARAGVRTGDVVEAVDGQPFGPTSPDVDPGDGPGASAELTLRRPGVTTALIVSVQQRTYDKFLPPTGRRLADGIGYIALPYFFSPGRETDYAATAARTVAAVDDSPTCGWVVDLRLDGGGSYSPMITGVGPILGDGTFVGWWWADGRQSRVSYDGGRITEDGREVSDYFGSASSSELHRHNPQVAVLVGPQTASAGEVTALAFVGRPGARLFGEATAGRTTANVPYFLYDGARLSLAEAAMTDRTGATHLAGIEPDEPVATDWATFGTDDDPVIAAAVDWLHRQPGCGATGDG